MAEKIRINKYLALCRVGSRRKCEEIILRGKVKLNGTLVKELGTMVDGDKDRVEVYGKAVKPQEDMVYYVLNKPKDVISASYSKYGEPTVVGLIGDKEHRLFPVGRLDKDTEGLILITNDGDFAYKLTHPKFEKKKTYEALVKGKIDSKRLLKLEKGIMLDDRPTAKAKVKLMKIVGGRDSIIQITLIEGRNRQVKRMCEKVGHPVIYLKRIQEGPQTLEGLEVGQFRKLKKQEIVDLLK